MSQTRNKIPPVVSIIGRPNVGKSAIFNRLLNNSQKALTYDYRGVTRDRHYGIANLDELRDVEPMDYIVVDTGGFYPEEIEEHDYYDKKQGMAFFASMADHVRVAVEESDIVLFVVDIREGLLPFDLQINEILRQTKKKYWVIVNKWDSEKQDDELYEFYQLGVDEDQLFPFSAAHGRGDLKLRRELQTALQDTYKSRDHLSVGVCPKHPVVGTMCIIGTPNAGKSTLLNCLLGGERALVSEVAGTTMDPIEGYLDFDFGEMASVFETDVPSMTNAKFLAGFLEQLGDREYSEEDDVFSQIEEFETTGESEEVEVTAESEEIEETLQADELDVVTESSLDSLNDEKVITEDSFRSVKLIDTAGVRRRSQVNGPLESRSVFRALKSMEESDIVLCLVDSTKGFTHQDRRLCDLAMERGKNIIIGLNKNDLLRKELGSEKALQEWIKTLKLDYRWLNDAQFVSLSAKYKKGIKKLLQEIGMGLLRRMRHYTTSELNQTLHELVERKQILVGGRGKKPFKIRYASQVKKGPPTFLLFCNRSQNIPDHYKRYLKNGLRDTLDLKGTPVHFLFRTSGQMEKSVAKIKDLANHK